MSNIVPTYNPTSRKLESGVPVVANQADSEASTIALLVTDFNKLLAKLKAAGIMVADAEDDA